MNWRCAAASLVLAVVVRFDGLEASYIAPEKGAPVAVMVHGLGAGRGEYEAFASTLAARGWGSLALDLRWHGRLMPPQESDWPKAADDIISAVRWLEKKGTPASRVVLLGGSLGANLGSLAYSKTRARGLVMLSPGIDYRGVGITKFDGTRVLAASSPEDRYAHYTVGQLKMLQPSMTVIEAKSGHGAQMLKDDAFSASLLAWLAALKTL